MEPFKKHSPNAEDCEKLRERLPHGYGPAVASRMLVRHNRRVTAATISRVLSGTLMDQEILIELIQLAEETEQKWRDIRRAMRGKIPVSRIKFHLHPEMKAS